MKYILIAIIVIIVILVILYFAVKASQSAARRVEQTEKKVKDSTSFMRDMTAKAEILMKASENDESMQAAKEVYEAFRYNDPISTDECKEIESEIKATFEEFSEALKSGANDSIIEKKDHLITLLNERNAVMKTSK